MKKMRQHVSSDYMTMDSNVQELDDMVLVNERTIIKNCWTMQMQDEMQKDANKIKDFEKIAEQEYRKQVDYQAEKSFEMVEKYEQDHRLLIIFRKMIFKVWDQTTQELLNVMVEKNGGRSFIKTYRWVAPDLKYLEKQKDYSREHALDFLKTHDIELF